VKSWSSPEDRCHLNGVCGEGERICYVTARAATDIVDGWRDHRRDGGVVIDVEANRIVAEGLSMPHSPRVHDGVLVGARRRLRPFVPHRPADRPARGRRLLPRFPARPDKYDDISYFSRQKKM
jgi:hypothetical protein